MKKKIYEKKSEKIIDFLIGFFGVPFSLSIVLVVVSKVCNYMKLNDGFILGIGLIVSLIGLGYSIYLGKKRKFIGIGMLFTFIVVPLVLCGTCLLAISGASILGSLFKR